MQYINSLFAVAADATDIIDTASSAFDLVSALVVTMVGFFIVVRIVKHLKA